MDGTRDLKLNLAIEDLHKHALFQEKRENAVPVTSTNARVPRHPCNEACKRTGHAQFVGWRLPRPEGSERLKKLMSNEVKRGKERVRRTQMSDSIRTLSTLIPQPNTTSPSSVKKLSRAEVMRLAVEYIRYLQHTVKQLETENRMFRALHSSLSSACAVSQPTAPSLSASSTSAPTTNRTLTSSATNSPSTHSFTQSPAATATTLSCLLSSSTAVNSTLCSVPSSANTTIIPTNSPGPSTLLSPSLSPPLSSPSPSSLSSSTTFPDGPVTDLFNMPDIEDLNGAWPLLYQPHSVDTSSLSQPEGPTHLLTPPTADSANSPDNTSLRNDVSTSTKIPSSVSIPLCVCQQSKVFPFCDDTHHLFNQETHSNLQPCFLSLDDYLTSSSSNESS
jgi:CDGSH-type Zn-finger protein